MQPQLFWIGSSLQAPPRSVASSWCRRFADAEEVWRQACLKTWATKQHSARIRTRVRDYGNLEIGFAGWMLGSGNEDFHWFMLCWKSAASHSTTSLPEELVGWNRSQQNTRPENAGRVWKTQQVTASSSGYLTDRCCNHLQSASTYATFFSAL